VSSSATSLWGPVKVGRAWFDRAVIGDPRTWLEDRLGPLATYEVVVVQETIEAPAEPRAGFVTSLEDAAPAESEQAHPREQWKRRS
jgi:hypothetical protein